MLGHRVCLAKHWIETKHVERMPIGWHQPTDTALGPMDQLVQALADRRAPSNTPQSKAPTYNGDGAVKLFIKHSRGNSRGKWVVSQARSITLSSMFAQTCQKLWNRILRRHHIKEPLNKVWGLPNKLKSACWVLTQDPRNSYLIFPDWGG